MCSSWRGNVNYSKDICFHNVFMVHVVTVMQITRETITWNIGFSMDFGIEVFCKTHDFQTQHFNKTKPKSAAVDYFLWVFVNTQLSRQTTETDTYEISPLMSRRLLFTLLIQPPIRLEKVNECVKLEQSVQSTFIHTTCASLLGFNCQCKL